MRPVLLGGATVSLSSNPRVGRFAPTSLMLQRSIHGEGITNAVQEHPFVGY